MRFCSFLLLSIIQPVFVYSQVISSNDSAKKVENLALVNHLVNTKQYEDALFVLNNYFSFSDSAYSDTLNYLKGWTFYQMKNRDSSAFYFERVSKRKNCYYKSQFFSALVYAYLRQYDKSKAILVNLSSPSVELNELRYFELSGISLLEKNMADYELNTKSLSYNLYSIREGELDLKTYSDKLKCFKPKSMVLAGTMSAIIPGTGKMYAGKFGEGLTALFAVSILSAITAENYYRSGPTNYKTLLFGGLLTTFYVGNIFGSIASVKLYRQEFYKKNENEILFSLHINLRNYFN
jgi:hypothetical protein